MNIIFEKMDLKHQAGIMRVYNYYVENSTAAFPSEAMPEQFYEVFMSRAEGHPAYALIDNDTSEVIGFCMLSAYIPLATFASTACLTYFIAPEYTGKGLGSECLCRLENEARQMNIKRLLADISSENSGSIAFHKQHGFTIVGELHDIGEKLGRKFGVVYAEKEI